MNAGLMNLSRLSHLWRILGALARELVRAARSLRARERDVADEFPVRYELFVLQMDAGVGGGALHVHDGDGEGWSRKSNVGIVGEAEAFFGNPDEIAVEAGVAILVMDDGNTVIARGQMLPDDDGLASVGSYGGRSIPERLVLVFGPTIG